MKPTDFIEHPEGGRYREVFRSSSVIQTSRGSSRSALTHIYFSLEEGEMSRFHKVASDEVWNLYQGAGLYLYLWDGTESLPERVTLSEAENCFCNVVPAGTWQAAEPIAGKVLAGCSVAPGFEFLDFELITPESDTARRLFTIAPELQRFTSP
ncbi:MAG: cupin domain-containing protein [Proteobacteria bacterium]|nr:cupin domain-containing protein [Pseudomonadota bacterium]MBU1737657.1 cupin domain-containing protein [Pseudomonadota bacterium]